MDYLNIILPVTPTAKGRPRLGKGRTYTPAKTLHAEQEIQLFTKVRLPRDFKPFIGPLQLCVTFGMKRPKSIPKSRIYPSVKPDIDNYVKLVMDSLNGILWADDAQIVHLTAIKQYSAEDFIQIVLLPRMSLDTCLLKDASH